MPVRHLLRRRGQRWRRPQVASVNREILERILEDLSPAQREVVSQLHHGPVKVVAAAGSGKTRTMAALYAIGLL
ncbi:MAG: UvrD-helicase domain-containing protein, partial [Candidatus Dormibacteria bacterium]